MGLQVNKYPWTAGEREERLMLQSGGTGALFIYSIKQIYWIMHGDMGGWISEDLGRGTVRGPKQKAQTDRAGKHSTEAEGGAKK